MTQPSEPMWNPASYIRKVIETVRVTAASERIVMVRCFSLALALCIAVIAGLSLGSSTAAPVNY